MPGRGRLFRPDDSGDASKVRPPVGTSMGAEVEEEVEEEEEEEKSHGLLLLLSPPPAGVVFLFLLEFAATMLCLRSHAVLPTGVRLFHPFAGCAG